MKCVGCSWRRRCCWFDTEKARIKANREMRNMRSDDDLSHNGTGIAQKTKPTSAVGAVANLPVMLTCWHEPNLRIIVVDGSAQTRARCCSPQPHSRSGAEKSEPALPALFLCPVSFCLLSATFCPQTLRLIALPQNLSKS
jgi:hypothetical protein